MAGFCGHQFNFLGLSDDESVYDKSRFVILPVPYEQTTTFGKGTADGPRAIISASHEVELFDDELLSEPYHAGIHTLPEMEITASGPEKMTESIYKNSLPLIENGKIICMLGGEHSISSGLVQAYHEKYPSLSVLQFDAHADLREMYQGQRFSHACAMKRIRDYVAKTAGIGIRNYSKEEHELIQKDNIPIVSGSELDMPDKWLDDILSYLTDDIYITIDCDFFDPSLMPGVGTPEPGGGRWYPILNILKAVAKRKNIVGFDVVELMPIPGSLVSEFTAARLIYKLIGYITEL